MLMPALEQYHDEAAIIGKLMLSYGELERVRIRLIHILHDECSFRTLMR